MKPLWRAAGSDCESDYSLTVRHMKHMVLVSIPGNILKVSAGPYVDVAPILDVAVQPRELIQVNLVNFIKLLLQSATS